MLLKKIRQSAKLSKVEFQKLLGKKTIQAYCYCEKNDKNISYNDLKRLAKQFPDIFYSELNSILK